jgi:hypothetical protein
MSQTAVFPLVGAVLGAILLAGCSSGPATPPSETYTSREEGFSVTYPSDWVKSTTGFGMNVSLTPPDQTGGTAFRDLIFVRVEGLAEEMPLDDFFSVKVARGAKAMADYKEIEKGAVKLNGQDARRLMWSYSHNETPVTSMAYFLVSGRRGYMIAGSAQVDRFAHRKASFEAVMSTFKVEGAQPAPAAPETPAPAAAPAPAETPAPAAEKPATPPAPAAAPAPAAPAEK